MLSLYSSLCSYFEHTDSRYLRNGHKKKIYEIFYRHVFTSTWPHNPADDPDDREFAIPVKQLSHVTHNKEMREITSTKEDGFYTMLPSRKVGKAYKWDGTPWGESFFLDCTPLPSVEELRGVSFTYVSNEESLMPEGYYSWWGVKTEGYFDQNIELDARALPGYLKNPPQSTYGNNDISGDLNKLLQSYQDSRAVEGEPNKPDIYLLVGGTLRYTREICCVVIVCTADDKESPALTGYRPVPMQPGRNDPNPTLSPNGLIDDTGKVVDLYGANQPIPTFCPKFLSTYKSWANLAFAFYFTNGDLPLKLECDRETAAYTVQWRNTESEILKFHPRCTKLQKPHLHGVAGEKLSCLCNMECPSKTQLPKEPCPKSH